MPETPRPVENQEQPLLGLDQLSSEEWEVVKRMRAQKEKEKFRAAFRRKAIALALAFEDWSENTGEGLTFSTFVNTFGYQGNDAYQMFSALQGIREAAVKDI